MADEPYGRLAPGHTGEQAAQSESASLESSDDRREQPQSSVLYQSAAFSPSACSDLSGQLGGQALATGLPRGFQQAAHSGLVQASEYYPQAVSCTSWPGQQICCCQLLYVFWPVHIILSEYYLQAVSCTCWPGQQGCYCQPLSALLPLYCCLSCLWSICRAIRATHIMVRLAPWLTASLLW